MSIGSMLRTQKSEDFYSVTYHRVYLCDFINDYSDFILRFDSIIK